jgi:hypothetical protein
MQEIYTCIFFLLIFCMLLKGSPSAAVKLLPCDHEVMGLIPGNSLLQKCRERHAYMRPKVAGPFPGPCASGSYVHRAALYLLYVIVICSSFTNLNMSIANLFLLQGDSDSQFTKLRKWWKSVDIFKKSYIILPINEM